MSFVLENISFVYV